MYQSILKSNKKKKDQSIETLRGLAIILMVAGHVIGHDSDAGMQVEDNSLFRYFYISFEFLRMPLFTVISGYVYALRPLKRTGVFPFLKGKSRRLLIPLITVGTLQFFTKYLVPETNATVKLHDIWNIYIFPFEHFWFLQALFWVFIIVAILEYNYILHSFKGWLITFAISFLSLIYLSGISNFFSIGSGLYLLPFFILGIGIFRYSTYLFNKPSLMLLGILFLSGITITQMGWFSEINFVDPMILGIMIHAGSFSGIALLFRFRFAYKPLAIVGFFAFGVYLFHVFGSASSRIVLQYFGIENHTFIFIFGLTAGLFFPVLLEIITLRYTGFQYLFFGKRFSPKKSEIKDKTVNQIKNQEEEFNIIPNK